MTLNEDTHAGEFMVSEANGDRSREEITVVDGQTLKAGHVVGIVTASGKYAEHDPAAGDGTEDAAGILYRAVTADGADETGLAIVRDAEVARGALVFKDGMSEPEKDAAAADLEVLGVIVR